MSRLSSSFFVSFTVHTLIALMAVGLYEEVQLSHSIEEKPICISLSHCIEVLPVAPAPEVNQSPLKSKPIPPEKTEVLKPSPPKPVVKPKPKSIIKTKPKPVVRQKRIVKPVAEAEPVKEMMVAKSVQAPEEVMPLVRHEYLPTPPVPSAEESYMQEHLAVIAKLLRDNLYYPRIARKRGITGEVVVAFELQENGEVRDIKIKSGKKSVLNRAAIITLERLSGEFPKPKEPVSLLVPIHYQLQ